jgi:G3E family GTPase
VQGSTIPITVLTGFLGSGKTTVLNGLLRHPEMANTAVVVNELGDIGLDHLLVRSSDENVVLLDSGCLCCTIHNTLRETLAELWLGRVRGELPPFDRVLVETTGLADPGPILQSITTDPSITDHFRLDGIVTCVDAVHAPRQLAEQPETARQIAVADRLVLTKTDAAPAARTEAVTARLAALNPAATVRRAVHGDVTPDEILGAGLVDPESRALDVARWLRESAYAGEDHGQDHGHHHEHGASRHDERIAAHCFHVDHPVSWAGLAAWCDLMGETHGPDLLRVKGLVGIAETGRPVIVHGVYRVFAKPIRLDDWPSEDRRTRLVIISRDLDEAYLRATLEVLRLPPGSGRPASLEEIVGPDRARAGRRRTDAEPRSTAARGERS